MHWVRSLKPLRSVADGKSASTPTSAGAARCCGVVAMTRCSSRGSRTASPRPSHARRATLPEQRRRASRLPGCDLPLPRPGSSTASERRFRSDHRRQRQRRTAAVKRPGPQSPGLGIALLLNGCRRRYPGPRRRLGCRPARARRWPGHPCDRLHELPRSRTRGPCPSHERLARPCCRPREPLRT